MYHTCSFFLPAVYAYDGKHIRIHGRVSHVLLHDCNHHCGHIRIIFRTACSRHPLCTSDDSAVTSTPASTDRGLPACLFQTLKLLFDPPDGFDCIPAEMALIAGIQFHNHVAGVIFPLQAFRISAIRIYPLPILHAYTGVLSAQK